MVESRVFRWANGSVVEEEWCDPHAGSVQVADSWLVVDGCAVSLSRHLERFATSLAARDANLDARAFAADAIAMIPKEGRWFPRLEAIDYGDGAMLRFHLREAPDALTDVALATAPRDPRTQTDVKGPDLAALGALRRELDVGEAVILDDGFVAEGAWSSIVWWQNDTLHIVDSSIPRLPSVTERTICDHAEFIGAPVVSARVRPADLVGAEVWALSALHGIRVVTGWRDGPAVHVEPGRVDYWRQQYLSQRQRWSSEEVRSQS
jgi:branched-subunit amino acid aminotransferase/4-amino-4-deoxychorismate lyase